MSEELANLFNKIRDKWVPPRLLRAEVYSEGDEIMGVWTTYIDWKGERKKEFTIFNENGLGKVISTIKLDGWGFI